MQGEVTVADAASSRYRGMISMEEYHKIVSSVSESKENDIYLCICD